MTRPSLFHKLFWDPSNYQRIRLWAGITSIGTNLALIWGLALSASWWASGGSDPVAISVVLLAVGLLVTLANLHVLHNDEAPLLDMESGGRVARPPRVVSLPQE